MNKQEVKSETVTVKVKPSVKKKLETVAKRKDRTLSYVINQILTTYVQN